MQRVHGRAGQLPPGLIEALADAVRARLDLDYPRKDGTTNRAHLEQVERQTGETLIEDPNVPPEGEWLWLAFWKLDAARGGNGFGPSSLSFTEIDAWARLNGVSLAAWEVEAIRAMDRAALEKVAELSK